MKLLFCAFQLILLPFLFIKETNRVKTSKAGQINSAGLVKDNSTFFVDTENGNDANDGLSKSKA